MKNNIVRKNRFYWFSQRDWELWDKKIEDYSKQGKLDFLVEEALQEKEKGQLKLL